MCMCVNVCLCMRLVSFGERVWIGDWVQKRDGARVYYVLVVVKEEGGDQSGTMFRVLCDKFFDLLLILNTYINYFLL